MNVEKKSQHDDDMIDDDVIDEEAHIERQARQKAACFDSDSASNSSPLINHKKIRSLRHAATLATDNPDIRSQHYFANEDSRGRAIDGSNALGKSVTTASRKTKLIAV